MPLNATLVDNRLLAKPEEFEALGGIADTLIDVPYAFTIEEAAAVERLWRDPIHPPEPRLNR